MTTADTSTIRAAASAVRLLERVQQGVAPGTVTALSGIYYAIVPILGAQKVTVRIKTTTNNGTLDFLFVGPDFPPGQSVAFASLVGTIYTTGKPTQVAVTAGTEAIINATPNGESYGIIKYVQGTGAGVITFCDVCRLALSVGAGS